MEKIERLLENMSIDDMCGQVLCYFTKNCFSQYQDKAELERIINAIKPGGIFVNNTTEEEISFYSNLINKYTKAPVIVSADVEAGTAGVLRDIDNVLPMPMALGAADDENLVEELGIQMARVCRKNGIHWTYSPLVDINYNSDNPVVNTRAISDSPEQIAKIAGAYVRGFQKEKNVATACKHFPGDGVDDRNQHFCTTLNNFSKEEWLNTYGYLYKKMIENNTASIMVAHIALPAFQGKEECDENGFWKPASLSPNIITGLLRKELGFKGCIVSDAMSMVGVAAVVTEEDMVPLFIKAGGDMALFAQPQDFYYLKKAVENGTVPLERLKDAVRNVLRLKEFVGLLDEEEKLIPDAKDIKKITQEITDKCISVVRNYDNIIPVDIKNGDHVLLCNLSIKEPDLEHPVFETLEKELNNRGITTTVLYNPSHKQIAAEYEKRMPDCVLVNSHISTEIDSDGGTFRFGFKQMSTFWRGVIFRHPKVIFTSFGDPYKLYEVPFMHTYVNAFSSTEETQKSFVKVLLGEIESKGKSPIEMKDFIVREV